MKKNSIIFSKEEISNVINDIGEILVVLRDKIPGHYTIRELERLSEELWRKKLERKEYERVTGIGLV